MELPPVMFHLSPHVSFLSCRTHVGSKYKKVLTCFKHGAVLIHVFKFNLYLSPKYCTYLAMRTLIETSTTCGFSVESSTLSLKITRLTSKPLYSGCSARDNSLASMKFSCGFPSHILHLSRWKQRPLHFTVAPTEDHLFPESKAGKCNLASSFFRTSDFHRVLLYHNEYLAGCG